LFMDREGVPVLVEVKRASDTRLRREVVAQMLDYAANGVTYLPIERLIERFCENAREAGNDPDVVLAEFLGDSQQETYWRQVEANLRAGRVRLVFVADRIPPELRRIVEFLNEQMRPAEILAVEVEQYTSPGGLRTLVPRLVSATQRAQASKSIKSGSEVASEEDLLNGLSPEARKVVERLTAWLRETGWEVGLPEGRKTLGAWVRTRERRPVEILSLDRSGRIWINLAYLPSCLPFEDPASVQDVLSRLRALSGLHLSSAEKYPTFLAQDIADDKTWAGLQAVLADIAARVQAD
jgi:hypothetical protein